jgi:hypothetical protein
MEKFRGFQVEWLESYEYEMDAALAKKSVIGINIKGIRASGN